MTAMIWFFVSASALTVGAVFGALALTLTDLSRSRLEEIAEERGTEGAAKTAKSIIDDIAGHAACVALPAIVFQLVAAAACVMWIAQIRGETLPTLASTGIGAGVAGIAVWLAGFWAPLVVAEQVGERAVMSMGVLVRGCHVTLTPVRPVLGFLAEVVRRLSGPSHQGTPEGLEQDLRDVVEEHANGEVDEVERDMLEAVVEFRTTTVQEIMRPRTDVQSLEYTDDLEAVKAMVNEHGHSRVPVHEGGIDKLVGVLYVKDLLRWIINHAGNGRPFVLRELLRDAMFVPETKTVRELLSEFLAARVHIAMVTDEYGGTSGLVTIEDIVEEVFGEIADEYDQPDEAEIGVEVDEHARRADADAKAAIDDANHELDPIGLELPESDDYDTVGGFVVSTLGRIPAVDESFEHGGVRVTILDAEPTRVVRVRLEQAQDEPEPAEAPADASE